MATLRLKLRKYNTTNPKVVPRYNIKLLQDPPSLRGFQIALNNRYQVVAVLDDEEQQQSIEEVWSERKQVYTSKETLGLKQNQHKEWITTETLSKIENRRKLKDKISSSRTRRLLKGKRRNSTMKPTRKCVELSNVIKES